MRAHPIKHEVKQHYRAGVRVHHYVRGEGSAPRQVIGARSIGSGPTYSVSVRGGGPDQRFTVNAGSIPSAITAGLNKASISVKSITVRRR